MLNFCKQLFPSLTYNKMLNTLFLQEFRVIQVRFASEFMINDCKHRTPVQKAFQCLDKAFYGGRHMVTMIPGSGIGPEMMKHVCNVFSFCNAPVDFETIEINKAEEVEYAITSIRRNGVAIKGNIEPSVKSAEIPSPNVALRQSLDLYINVMHCKAYPNVICKQPNLDIICIRQNTEGEYSMLEHESVQGVVESMRVITRSNTTRFARWACKYALRNGRKKITIVHKANIIKLSDGLFRKTFFEIGKEYSDLDIEDMIVDNFSNQVVINPRQFDVVVMPNLYGAIATNLLCGLLGGAGLIAGRNYGDYYSIFEPGTRNTATQLTGKNSANPVAMLNASVELLRYLGHKRYADMISDAIYNTVAIDKIHTADLGGTYSGTDVVESVKDNINKLALERKVFF